MNERGIPVERGGAGLKAADGGGTARDQQRGKGGHFRPREERAFPRSPSPASLPARARTPPRARLQRSPLPAPHLTPSGTPSRRPTQVAPAAALVSTAAPHPSQPASRWPSRGGLSAGPDSVPGQPSPVSSSSRNPRLHLGGKQWKEMQAPEKRDRLTSPPAEPRRLAPGWGARGADGRAGPVRGRGAASPECLGLGEAAGGRRAGRGSPAALTVATRPR